MEDYEEEDEFFDDSVSTTVPVEDEEEEEDPKGFAFMRGVEKAVEIRDADEEEEDFF